MQVFQTFLVLGTLNVSVIFFYGSPYLPPHFPAGGRGNPTVMFSK